MCSAACALNTEDDAAAENTATQPLGCYMREGQLFYNEGSHAGQTQPGSQSLCWPQPWKPVCTCPGGRAGVDCSYDGELKQLAFDANRDVDLVFELRIGTKSKTQRKGYERSHGQFGPCKRGAMDCLRQRIHNRSGTRTIRGADFHRPPWRRSAHAWVWLRALPWPRLAWTMPGPGPGRTATRLPGQIGQRFDVLML